MKCPHCKEESFAKKKTVMDGWKVVGSIEVCALCGAQLSNDSAGEKKDDTPPKSARLSALLGGESVEKITLAGKADSDFCRNCRHFVVHPFKSICALTDADTDPNGSCAQFKAKKSPSDGQDKI